MKFLATILTWLAFLGGLPQILYAIWMIYGLGWWGLIFSPFIALPLAPVFQRERRNARPLTTCGLAILSIVASTSFYQWILRAPIPG